VDKTAVNIPHPKYNKLGRLEDGHFPGRGGCVSIWDVDNLSIFIFAWLLGDPLFGVLLRPAEVYFYLVHEFLADMHLY